MKNVLLLIVIPVLLVTLGLGQTPTPSGNTDQASIKGCLGGSDGSYTVAEDGTTHTFKVTSTAVDLKPHVGHDVEVIGQKTVATSSDPSDNSVVVTGLNMLSEHCAPATTSAANTSTPAVADTTPAVSTSTPAVVADTTPTATASTPAVANTTPTTTASTSVVADPAPAQTATMPMETASTPMPAKSDTSENTEHLPNTATPLPLLGLLGLGLLATGLLSRRSRTNQQ